MGEYQKDITKRPSQLFEVEIDGVSVYKDVLYGKKEFSQTVGSSGGKEIIVISGIMKCCNSATYGSGSVEATVFE